MAQFAMAAFSLTQMVVTNDIASFPFMKLANSISCGLSELFTS